MRPANIRCPQVKTLNILLTSSRAPVTLDLIRAFGQAGHRVYATDTTPWTPGSGSRHLTQHIVTHPPRQQPARFIRMLQTIIETHRIDLLVPTCEEVFYIAGAYAELAQQTGVYCEPLDRLSSWHNKWQFQQRAAALGLRTPRTVRVCSAAELAAQLPDFPYYLIKPVFSRFGQQVITNCGPAAGQLTLDRCQPTPRQPWLLQEFIDGEPLSSYSTLHQGHVTTHCTYRTPYRIGLGAGIGFLSVGGAMSAATLAIVRLLGRASGYTGQMGLDYLCGNDGQIYLLECNPRATSGLHLMDPARLVAGIRAPERPTWITPAGRRKQLTPAVLSYSLRQLLIKRMQLGDDVLLQRTDPLPALYQVPLLLHLMQIRRHTQLDLAAAATYEIEWNGDADCSFPEP